MNEALSDSKRDAYHMFLTAHARLYAKIAHEMEAAGGLSFDVYDVLVTLEYQPETRLRMSELADKILLSRSGLTRRLDRLEKMGYIRRENCDEDRRGAYAILTEQGQAAREQAWPVFRAAIKDCFGDRMTEGEAKQLAAVMVRIIEPLERKR
ncbi:MAG: MarR family transcriptional regulator [Armatimonadetes bacterium]|nr:MarR family transcriptional regulator [Armatimonadota bacterium]